MVAIRKRSRYGRGRPNFRLARYPTTATPLAVTSGLPGTYLANPLIPLYESTIQTTRLPYIRIA